MTTAIVNREAGDVAKGPRLQRLRCIELILKAIEESDRPHIYAAVEHKEDVYVKDAQTGTDYLEQNKNYDPSSSFTFNSKEVSKSFAAFCDQWCQYVQQSEDVYFGFYATNLIGKESATQRVKDLGVTLPDKPLLELLQTKQFDYPHFMPAAKTLIIDSYKEIYSGTRANDGFVDVLNKMSDGTWQQFLSLIDWKFGEVNELELKPVLLAKIKDCKLFNQFMVGQEEMIFSRLMELVDEKQSVKDALGKFINIAEVKLIFQECGAAFIKPKENDPVYKIWDNLEAPTDKRTVLDKMKSACTGITASKLANIARKTAAGRILQSEKETDRSFLSLKYRIYDKCQDEMDRYLQKIGADTFQNEAAIDELFAHLVTTAKIHVDECATDFEYSLKSSAVIENIILELFDSCYLAIN